MKLTPAELRKLQHEPLGEGGNRLAAAMALKKLTQNRLAELMREAGYDVTQPRISDVVRGRYESITLDNAYKFAEFFGCAIEDLFPAKEQVA